MSDGKAKANDTIELEPTARKRLGVRAVERMDEERAFRVRLDTFILPAEKEKGALEPYEDVIGTVKALETTIDLQRPKQPLVGLKQGRAGSEKLRSDWARQVGVEPSELNKAWTDAGGGVNDEGQLTLGEKNDRTVDIDHIVELQFQGSNRGANLRPLPSDDNQKSGGEIFAQTSKLATSIAEEMTRQDPELRPRTIILSFANVDQRAPKAWEPGEIVEKIKRRAPKGTKPAVEAEEGETVLALSAGAHKETAWVSGKEERLEDKAKNRPARAVIPGLVLERVDNPNRRAVSFIESKEHRIRSGHAVPIELRSHKSGIGMRMSPDQPRTGGKEPTPSRLTFDPAVPKLKFFYPWLSEGELDVRVNDAGELDARGWLQPTWPLLRNTRANVWLNASGFGGSLDVPPDKLSLPPFVVTKSALGVTLAPTFDVRGDLEFMLGRRLKGTATATFGDGIFIARGELAADLPNIDRATGMITYRYNPSTGASELNGVVDITTTQVRIPWIQRAAAHLVFDGSTLTPSGELLIGVPRTDGLLLTIERPRDPRHLWLATGRATLRVPYLEPVDLEVTYDGERLFGRASTNVTVAGIDGRATVEYRDGLLSGSGSITFAKGRVRGKGHVAITRDARGEPVLTAEGSITVPLAKGLDATAGVVLRPDGNIRVRGEIGFPPRIILFEPLTGDRTLFRTEIVIPIAVIPGLVVTITPAVGVFYKIGPGALVDTKLTGELDPFDDLRNVDVQAKTRFEMPLDAGIWLSVRGAMGLSVGVASVTGGITVKGTLALHGLLFAGADLAYHLQVFTLAGELGITVTPELLLDILADITAKAGLFGVEAAKKWEWKLAAFRWGSGLTVGVRFPFEYASDKPFVMPSWDRIQWIYPKPADLDMNRLLQTGLDPGKGSQSG